MEWKSISLRLFVVCLTRSINIKGVMIDGDSHIQYANVGLRGTVFNPIVSKFIS